MRLSASLAELPTLDEVRQERARRSLSAFATHMTGLVPARHHVFVNEKLEAVERGEITRLMLFERIQHTGEGGGPIRVRPDLSKLTNEELDALERILGRATDA